MSNIMTSDSVTINGKKIKLKAFADLPRSVRRQIRNSLFKAAPNDGTDKMDLYTAGFDAGLTVLKALGVNIDPNDESLPLDEAEALDQVVFQVGLRVMGEMNEDGGGRKNAKEKPKAEEPKDE